MRGNFGQILLVDLHGEAVHAAHVRLPEAVYRDSALICCGITRPPASTRSRPPPR